MKNLNLKDLHDLLELNENILSSRAIRHYLSGLIMEFLNKDDIDCVGEFNTTNQDFLEECKSTLLGKEFNVSITNDTFLKVQYNAECLFEYEAADETSVGGGMKGDVCGVSDSWIIITKITLFCGDGSVFDFTHNELIPEYLEKNIFIE